MISPTIQTPRTVYWRENAHRSGKGKNVASVLKYHGKMWYNFAVPHFAVPNSHLPNPLPPPAVACRTHQRLLIGSRRKREHFCALRCARALPQPVPDSWPAEGHFGTVRENGISKRTRMACSPTHKAVMGGSKVHAQAPAPSFLAFLRPEGVTGLNRRCSFCRQRTADCRRRTATGGGGGIGSQSRERSAATQTRSDALPKAHAAAPTAPHAHVPIV